MDSCICSEGIRFLEAPWRATGRTQQEPGTLEGPVSEIRAECLIEAIGSLLLVLCEKRARV